MGLLILLLFLNLGKSVDRFSCAILMGLLWIYDQSGLFCSVHLPGYSWADQLTELSFSHGKSLNNDL